MSLRARILALAAPFGVYPLARWLTRSTPKILMYHRFSGQPQAGRVHRRMFEQQVQYLKQHFRIMSLGELLTHHEQHGHFPARTVVLTVDDGYRDFYDIAFPVLKQHDVPATFFIATRFVDGGFWLWPDRLRYILQQSTRLADRSLLPAAVTCPAGELDAAARNALWSDLVAWLLSVEDTRKQQWLENFAGSQQLEVPAQPTAPYRAVNWRQVREMHECGIEIGAHSRSHPSLGRVADDSLAGEIGGSVQDITRQLGQAPVSFCYPNGQPGDYNERVIAEVAASGCKGAVTAFYDRYLLDDIYALRRFDGGNDWSHFMKVCNGIEGLTARWLGASTAHFRAVSS